jgi:D-alanyl-D-alanine carboxypeptidase
MEKPLIGFIKNNVALFSAIFIIVLAAFCYGGYEFFKLKKEFTVSQQENSQLKTELLNTQTQNVSLATELGAQKEVNNSFKDQISSISGTVSGLDKLSKTDPQLLQKYSKVYFLNENYVPASLSDIGQQFVFEKAKTLQIHTNVKTFLERMLAAAQQDGAPLSVISAYRSFGAQAGLKTSYKFTYGAGTANSFSADQGYSEHQLGTAVDLTTPDLGTAFSGFDKTAAYTWLKNHAQDYGFIISYPKENTYYTFEPWHWRFVGVSLAQTLHGENRYFYDMDQREINAFLVHLFD